MLSKIKQKRIARRKRSKIIIENGQISVRSPKAYLYLLPAIIVLAVFLFYPLIKILRMGFFEKYVYITGTGTGFGLSSFVHVLKDPVYQLALKNTCIIVFIGVPITVGLALLIAILINSLTKGKGFFQCAYFLPYVTSIYAVGIVFKWLFHSDYGYINLFMNIFGADSIKWLTDPQYVVFSVTIFTIWNGLALKVILFLAGLQKIDKQYYQAAKVDGTGRGRVFSKITMPLLSPTIWMVTMISVIHAFKTYNEIVALYGKEAAGPGNSAITVIFYIYNMFFTKGQVHYAAAAALIFLIIVVGLTAIQKLISKRFVYYV